MKPKKTTPSFFRENIVTAAIHPASIALDKVKQTRKALFEAIVIEDGD